MKAPATTEMAGRIGEEAVFRYGNLGELAVDSLVKRRSHRSKPQVVFCFPVSGWFSLMSNSSWFGFLRERDASR